MKKLITNGLLLLFLVTTSSMQAQQKTVKGTITDGDGLPLSGASVIVKGTSKGTAADFDGRYTITVSENDILVMSFLGYITQEQVVSGKTTIDVTLTEDASKLDEIVVVGFGTQKKSNISGAVTTVKMDEVLGDRPVTTVSTALQGVAAGLLVVNSSGQPGRNNTSIELRGFGSINNATPPLILVDNVEMSLQDINPNDIENVSILKDAAASSIYGARGAWGVILITTKKPERDQKIKFDYRSTVSFSSPVQLPEKPSIYEFINVLKTAGITNYWSNQSVDTWLGYLEDYKVNPGNYPTGTVLDADGFNYPLKETYPIEQLLDSQGTVIKHDFSFSGGSAKSSYRVSTSYSEEDGIIVTDNDSFDKYNINAFLDTDLGKKIKSTTNIFYRKSERSNPIGRYNQAINEPVWLPTGNYTLEDGSVLPFDSPDNLERLLPHTKVKTDVIRMFQKVTYEPIDRLKFSGEFTFERGNTTTKGSNIQLRTVNRAQYVPNNSNPDLTSVSKNFSEYEQNAFNFYINYGLSFNEIHNIDAMAGYNKETSFSNGFNINRLNLLSTDVPAIDAAIGTIDGGDFFTETAVVGYFGRLQYNFKEKYFIEGNIRHDGSSKFPRSDRYGTFISFSGAWNVKKESFLADADWVSLLKFRGSYGEIGNQDIPGNPYPYISQWSPRDTWLLNESGVRYTTIQPGQLVSPSLTWETAQKTNLALDAAFLSNRLSTTFEVYQNRTLDMLIPGAELPAVLGTDAPVTNAGDLETKGWEADIAWRAGKGDFKYGLNFNMSNNETKITKFDNPAGLLTNFYEGQTIGEIWGYVTDGYYTIDDFVDGTLDANLNGDNRQLKDGVVAFESGAIPYPGDVKYVDLDGDGIVTDGENTLENPGDRKIIGNSRRGYIFGLNGNASYKGFDFSFALSGVGKRDRNLTGAKAWPYIGQFDDMFKHQLDIWTPDNQDAFYPRIYGNNANFSGDRGNYGHSRRTQTKYLRDASYIRINNITLGYSLPRDILEKIKFTKIRLFVSGENLHTFHQLPKGIDPDVNADGAYPVMKNIAIGAQLSF
ncbi:SusC/RagA family TonB-linked outer membrane protein [Flavivirga spongiicola]|uniref:TonB-dependent receptor n=1 Tax=Flavivirga spongiicola TaxID=421621 RepID=A0ABU7XWU0_9FLAO|nr:TonB-dependent receptor [Flavivirga sp. MEBiC05379]MDO5980227.1 TonB-dependent receptor [Flavivirga sp. MEBiC05379]